MSLEIDFGALYELLESRGQKPTSLDVTPAGRFVLSLQREGGGQCGYFVLAEPQEGMLGQPDGVYIPAFVAKLALVGQAVLKGLEPEEIPTVAAEAVSESV